MSKGTNVFALALGVAIFSTTVAAGCDESTGDDDVSPEAIRPFSIAARVDNATVEEVTAALAGFIEGVDDTTRSLPADWVVAGAGNLRADETALEAALSLPGGTKVIEVCNHHYAAQAMSFGGHHGVALPCEIGVIQQGDAVEVVLLNPEAIFGVFFGDIPAEAAAQMSGLAASVRAELEDLVAAGVADMEASFPKTDVGPEWIDTDLGQFAQMDYSIEMDIDIPASYLVDADSRQAFRELFVATLLDTLTFEGAEKVGSQVANLSVSDWRSARPYALGLPGSVSVVEMCSPTYATAAMSTGAYHAPALPCQTAIWVDGDVLRIHLLDPMFIFPVFFSDAPAEMMESMGGMASAVRGDIQLMVEAARATALGLAE